VLIHRILARSLEGKAPMKASKLEARCKHCSDREIKAQKASRDSIKYKQCEYMSDKIGKVYHNCTVISVMEYGLFIEIPETASEGLVRMVDIGGDTFQADTQNHRVVGFNTGEVIRLGDVVSIVVKGVDIERKNIDLTLIRL
jgi:ribonuclease R